MSDKPTTQRVVILTIETDGYHSRVEFPYGSDPAEAVLPWLEMQMDYLRRWVPGSTAHIREVRPA